MKRNQQLAADDTAPSSVENHQEVLREWVAHLRQRRTSLREEWLRRVRQGDMLPAMSDAEALSDATSLYNNYVEVLETGSVEALQAYAQALCERIIPREVETHE